MHNELTRGDIQQMKDELEYRRNVLLPQLLEEVKTARAFGDLSENFEYKAAKREKGRNDSRIRYLENMIRTAVVIREDSTGGGIGLYDTITLYIPEDDEEEVFQIVTTVRQDVLHGRVSKESPVGKALLGKHQGDRVYIQVNDRFGYEAEIRRVEKGRDDGSIPINKY